MDFSAAERIIDDVRDSSQSVLNGISAQVAEKVTPLVREILEARYFASGMKVKSGKMIRAIRETTVKVKMYGKKPSIVYSLPAGIDDYGGSSGFYEIFAGQSYGSVRGVPRAKKKDKKGIKKNALRGKTGIAGQYQYANGKVKSVNESGTVSVGSVIVTKPRDFWVMNNSEQATVKAAVLSEYRKLLQRRAK